MESAPNRAAATKGFKAFMQKNKLHEAHEEIRSGDSSFLEDRHAEKVPPAEEVSPHRQ